MSRLQKYLDIVERRIVNPYGTVNSAALARLVKHDLPLLRKMLWSRVFDKNGEEIGDAVTGEIERMITDEDLKVWGHPVEEELHKGTDANCTDSEGESPPF